MTAMSGEEVCYDESSYYAGKHSGAGFSSLFTKLLSGIKANLGVPPSQSSTAYEPESVARGMSARAMLLAPSADASSEFLPDASLAMPMRAKYLKHAYASEQSNEFDAALLAPNPTPVSIPQRTVFVALAAGFPLEAKTLVGLTSEQIKALPVQEFRERFSATSFRALTLEQLAVIDADNELSEIAHDILGNMPRKARTIIEPIPELAPETKTIFSLASPPEPVIIAPPPPKPAPAPAPTPKTLAGLSGEQIKALPPEIFRACFSAISPRILTPGQLAAIDADEQLRAIAHDILNSAPRKTRNSIPSAPKSEPASPLAPKPAPAIAPTPKTLAGLSGEQIKALSSDVFRACFSATSPRMLTPGQLAAIDADERLRAIAHDTLNAMASKSHKAALVQKPAPKLTLVPTPTPKPLLTPSTLVGLSGEQIKTLTADVFRTCFSATSPHALTSEQLATIDADERLRAIAHDVLNSMPRKVRKAPVSAPEPAPASKAQTPQIATPAAGSVTVFLAPKLAAFVAQQIEAGLYRDPSELINESLRIFQKQEDLRVLRFSLQQQIDNTLQSFQERA